MWKESYRIGIKKIDQQHYELFKMVDHLMRVIRVDKSAKHKNEYAESVNFMTDYVYEHFTDEEKHMANIQYRDFKAHKKEHDLFRKTILEYKEGFEKAGYRANEIKKFAGTLVTWLIYHVAKSDLKIAEPALDIEKLCLQCLQDSATEVFQKMGGAQILHLDPVHSQSTVDSDIRVKISFIGDLQLSVFFAFPKETAFQLIKNMTFMEIEEVDDLVCSAMAEIVNITSGNVATLLTGKNFKCDIKPPIVIVGQYDHEKTPVKSMQFHTNAGKFNISIAKSTVNLQQKSMQ